MSMAVRVHWRKMQTDDLAEICRIAVLCHPGFSEDAAVIAEKQRLSPDSCFVLENGGSVAGYLIAHPWIKGSAPALDEFLGRIPANADVLYLHDLALLPEARGGGNAARGAAVVSAFAVAAGYRAVALIAVNNSAPFWRRQGFKAVKPSPALAEKLETYSDDALYMMKKNL